MSDAAMRAYYARDLERDRLGAGVGRVEFLRTTEIVERTLPAAPAVVADIGGGPGRYTDWLVERGHRVVHRDPVEHHVRQVLDHHAGRVDSAVGDARRLDVADESVAAVLLLGPMYHLEDRAERTAALQEAARVARPGGPIYIAAICRWGARLDGILTNRLYEEHPQMLDVIDEVERTGRMEPIFEGSFTGFKHSPDGLREEIVASGLCVESLVAVEGIAFTYGDLDERLDDPLHRRVLLDSLRATESVPELLGATTHLLATARAAG